MGKTPVKIWKSKNESVCDGWRLEDKQLQYIIFTYFTQIVVLAKKFLNLEPHVNEPHTTSTKLIFE